MQETNSKTISEYTGESSNGTKQYTTGKQRGKQHLKSKQTRQLISKNGTITK